MINVIKINKSKQNNIRLQEIPRTSNNIRTNTKHYELEGKARPKKTIPNIQHPVPQTNFTNLLIKDQEDQELARIPINTDSVDPEYMIRIIMQASRLFELAKFVTSRLDYKSLPEPEYDPSDAGFGGTAPLPSQCETTVTLDMRTCAQLKTYLQFCEQIIQEVEIDSNS